MANVQTIRSPQVLQQLLLESPRDGCLVATALPPYQAAHLPNHVLSQGLASMMGRRGRDL